MCFKVSRRKCGAQTLFGGGATRGGDEGRQGEARGAPAAEMDSQEEEKPFEVEADAECFESSQDLVHEIFRVDGGRKFAGFTNTSVLYSHTYEISYETACEDSCFACAAQVTFANRVKKDGKWIAVPGKFLILSLHLLVLAQMGNANNSQVFFPPLLPGLIQ